MASRPAEAIRAPVDDLDGLHASILGWFEKTARDLPWRHAGPDGTPDPWSVLVSEVMLQQTPVIRVLPVFEAWMQRWPTPASLAAEPSSEAVRGWGRLGYPRRALRLHAAAVAITERHDGRVPAGHADLLALPGVGEYTAAAVASFAFEQQHVVLDTNVRRVLTRIVQGEPFPAASITVGERRIATALLPRHEAHRWAAATMELGALVCTAKAPRCAACPVADRCRWLARGRPDHEGPPRRGQAWHGTDRQCRGRLMAVLRDATRPVAKDALDIVWDDDTQRERCLDALLDDGLAQVHPDGTFSL